MQLLIVLIVGGLVGWVASVIVNKNEQMGIFWNIIVGVLGASISNWLFAPLLGIKADLSTFNFSSFLVAILGSAVLLAVINLFTRKKIQ